MYFFKRFFTLNYTEKALPYLIVAPFSVCLYFYNFPSLKIKIIQDSQSGAIKDTIANIWIYDNVIKNAILKNQEIKRISKNLVKKTIKEQSVQDSASKILTNIINSEEFYDKISEIVTLSLDSSKNLEKNKKIPEDVYQKVILVEFEETSKQLLEYFNYFRRLIN